jgi:hypothetical protein
LDQELSLVQPTTIHLELAPTRKQAPPQVTDSSGPPFGCCHSLSPFKKLALAWLWSPAKV